MSLRKSQAIVLRKTRSGEKDLVAYLLLESGEQRPLRLHGIASSRNRSPLLAEPGSLIEFDYYENQKEELSLREGTVLKRHDRLKDNYIHQTLLARILQLGGLAGSGSPDPATFTLLRSALEFAETVLLDNESGEPHQFEAFLIFLCVRCLDLMGLLGATTHCAQCDRSLSGKASFGDGAFFLCDTCNSLANAIGFQCSVEIGLLQNRRYRDMKDHVEKLDSAVFEQLKYGLQKAMRFSLPQPPLIFA